MNKQVKSVFEGVTSIPSNGVSSLGFTLLFSFFSPADKKKQNTIINQTITAFYFLQHLKL